MFFDSFNVSFLHFLEVILIRLSFLYQCIDKNVPKISNEDFTLHQSCLLMVTRIKFNETAISQCNFILKWNRTLKKTQFLMPPKTLCGLESRKTAGIFKIEEFYQINQQRLSSFSSLHSVISQKIELFITTIARSWNHTYLSLIYGT
jgi:hypothetical protein